MVINQKDIMWMTRHNMDSMGLLFFYKDKYYRLINEESRDFLMSLFESGLIDNAIKSGFLVDTKIADDLCLEGYENRLLVCHGRLPFCTYFWEWSKDMFLDALKMLVEFDIYLAKYGYELMDPHPWNIGFWGTRPVYLDLGSIVKRSDNNLMGIDSIRRLWINPYLIYVKTGYDYQYWKGILRCGEINNGRFFRLLNSPLLMEIYGRFKDNKLKLYNKIYFEDSLTCGKANSVLSLICKKIQSTPQKQDHFKDRMLIKTYKDVCNIIKRNHKLCEAWSEYDEKYIKKGIVNMEDQRIKYYVDLISSLEKRYELESVMEIAGNSGYFCEAFLRRGLFKNALCTDYNMSSIDKGFNRIKNDDKISKQLSFSVFNMMEIGDNGIISKKERYKSDVVMALAVTHHLILTQKYRLETIVDILSEYTKKILIIEYMPLGMWDGKDDDVKIPDWYNLEWFINCFTEKFRLIKHEKIKKNRVVVVFEKNGD